MNSTLLDLGFFQIKWYSFFILVAILTAYIIIRKESKKEKLNEDFISNLFFYGVLIGILGARLYYVLFNFNYYISNPIEILMIWNGGLAIHGGIIATLIFVIIYCRKNNVSILKMTDIIVVGLLLAQSIGRWGNFFNGEAYGRIVSKSFFKKLHLPRFIMNGMYIDHYYREPTFLYESIFSFIGFTILILLKSKKKTKNGQLTGTYLIWYGLERIIIETFRSDSLMIGSLKVAQIVSLLAIISGIYLCINTRNKQELGG